MKIKSFIFLLIIMIVLTSSGCLESKNSPVPNETKNVTPVPSPNITEQEQPVNNETKLLKINDTFETWSRGYRSNTSYEQTYFRIITNYNEWIAFLNDQRYFDDRFFVLEGELFPGVGVKPKTIEPSSFDDYFIIAAMMGYRGKQGPEIEIMNISKSNNILNVTIRLYDTHFGQTIVTAPYHIVIVKRELLSERNSTFVFVSTEGKELEKLNVENK